MTPDSMESHSIWQAFTMEHLRRVLPYCASYGLVGLIVGTPGPALDHLAGQTGSTLSQISIIFVAMSLGYIFGAILSGRLYDCLPGARVLSVALFGLSGMLVLLPMMPTLWLLVLVMLVVGFVIAFQDVGSNTLVIWHYGREAGPYTNALQLAFGIGAFFAPFLVDRVFKLGGGIRGVFWIQAAMVMLVALWLTRVASPPHPPADADSNSHADTSLRRGRVVGLTVMIAALLGLHLGAELGFGDWIFSYAVALNIGTHTLARVLNSVYWGTLTLGRLIAVPLAAWLLPRTMLLIDLIGAGLSIGVILLLPGWPPALWIGTAGFGLSMASFYASAINFTERRVAITGRVTSYLLIGSVIGEMTMPWFIGQLFAPVGPQILMITMGATMLVSLGLLAATLIYVRGLPPRNRSTAEYIVGESTSGS